MTSVRPRPNRPAGVYVHIPFCARLCPYCDFAVSVRKEIPHEAYVDAVIAEARRRMNDEEFQGRTFSTVYFGGGTPTLLDSESLERLVRFFRDELGLAQAEWSFEANPIDLTPTVARRWRGFGFERVSLGVQSFDDGYLKRLGRQHDGSGARRAIDAAFVAGFDVSFDLIFAGPGHDLATWSADLDVLERLERVDHVSAYHLTVEPNTVFARRAANGRLDLPDDDVAVSMLEMLRDRCRARGVEQYEVSSYAATGKRSQHNSHYWTGSEYVGLGVGAHGLVIEDEVVRTENSRRLNAYLSAPTAVREVESIDPTTHLAERAFTGLRSAFGLNLTELREQFEGTVEKGAWVGLERALERVSSRGFGALEGGRFVPTEQGYLFADLAGEWVYEAVMGADRS